MAHTKRAASAFLLPYEGFACSGPAVHAAGGTLHGSLFCADHGDDENCPVFQTEIFYSVLKKKASILLFELPAVWEQLLA